MTEMLPDLPQYAVLLVLLANLLLGLGVGLVYFRAVWCSAQTFAAGRSIWLVLLLAAGRLVLLGGALAVISREGALPLLLAALGVLVSRALVMRRVGRVPA